MFSIKRSLWYSLGLVVMIAGLERQVLATLAVVPEFDATTLSSGLVLLSASVLLYRARQRSK